MWLDFAPAPSPAASSPFSRLRVRGVCVARFCARPSPATSSPLSRLRVSLIKMNRCARALFRLVAASHLSHAAEASNGAAAAVVAASKPQLSFSAASTSQATPAGTLRKSASKVESFVSDALARSSLPLDKVGPAWRHGCVRCLMHDLASSSRSAASISFIYFYFYSRRCPSQILSTVTRADYDYQRVMFATGGYTPQGPAVPYDLVHNSIGFASHGTMGRTPSKWSTSW